MGRAKDRPTGFEGIVRDPELYRRVSERADPVRRQMLEKFGVQEIAADIVGEMRDVE